MSLLKIGILLGGFISLLVANGHRTFYKFFEWKKTFQKISVLDSKLFYTVHLFLIPIFLLFSYISFFHTEELVQVKTDLSRDLLIFYCLFWLSRGIWQIVYFPTSGLEDKKKANRVRFIVLGASSLCFMIYMAPLIVKWWG